MILTIPLILILLLVVGLMVRTNLIRDQDGNIQGLKKWPLIAGTLVLGLLVIALQPITWQRVDAGYVGIKVSLSGDDRGIGKYEYKTGWNPINTWNSRLYEFPTFQQTIEYDSQQVITKGGFNATIHPKFNYSLKPGEIGDMFANLRVELETIEQKWLKNAIVGAMNDIANTWTVDSIFIAREKFEGAIMVEANKRVSHWFIVSQLRTNITPPQSLIESINAKTRAIQDVQVADNERLVEVARGQKKVASAKADSAVLVINAAGKAEAMRREQLNITELYNEYLRVQKWNGALPQVMSGPANGLLLNLPK